ncbi:MAG: aspartate--tRNA ligase [Candidatus Liptonbacteria bacterium]|nr:aspartate--tRNA ligase [Candidatus Liptonbacteria bacterium]
MRTLINEITGLVGQEAELAGWIHARRDHGKLIFFDLRDRSGVAQCVITPEKSFYQEAGKIRPEWAVRVKGEVKRRPKGMENPDLPTGNFEVEIKALTVLNPSEPLPLPIDGDGYEIDESVRLRYRYVDLRRPRLNKILQLRSKYARAVRDALYDNCFTEVETPMLTKATKEGARDFIVPSRMQPGKFYALPQSPQQYKQLLMIAGVERYFQFARCIRDEDLRADRGFEHTQVDIEMSFVEQQDVMAMVEKVVRQAVTQVGGKIKQNPFPVVAYAEAMKKYKADKFDLRTEEEKKEGVLAFAWVINFPFFKKVDRADVAEIRDGKSGWTFTHNPFSQPMPEYLTDHLAGKNIGDILTTQYDLVCNGYEVGGGSIRAHDPEVLRATLRIMGYTEEQIEASVGHMLEAFSYGAPPHGGIALGLDRHVMLLAGEESLREVIAFPMTSGGQTAVMDAPCPVDPQQLEELHLKIVEKTVKGKK